MLEAEREEANDLSDGEEIPRDSGLGPDSDAGSIRSSPVRRPSTRIARHSRNASNSSYRSIGRNYRMSLMSGTGSEGHGRANGISLADELVFDEEEEDLGDLELDSDDFPDGEMRARRALESRQSMCQDEKAKRILGLSIESQQANRDSLPAVAEPETPRPKQRSMSFHKKSHWFFHRRSLSQSQSSSPSKKGRNMSIPASSHPRLSRRYAPTQPDHILPPSSPMRQRPASKWRPISDGSACLYLWVPSLRQVMLMLSPR
jgi:hypothetical protein